MQLGLRRSLRQRDEPLAAIASRSALALRGGAARRRRATLATYERGDRFYILGQAGDRYSIRVTQPDPRRVEAIVSVDGLDVIDGEDADFVNKRGYIVPPGGDLVVDGFRMSATQVAAFRFGSVDSSYAQLKGKGRNVGVIGVAIFEEKAEPQIVARSRPRRTRAAGAAAGGGGKPSRRRARAPDRQRARRPVRAPTGGDPAAEAGRPPAGSVAASLRRPPRRATATATRPARKESRPGLGTQWGEERYSAVNYTRFERASATVPTAVAELRYNDAEGLRALGIPLQPTPDGDELYQRETADPFPAARGFATPPQ